MSRAYYNISKVTADKVFITDDGVDVMSVTNDAECVVREIAGAYPGKRIIYRDSMGQWDELLHKNGEFVDFARYTESLGD